MKKPVILWFRNDLRVADNPALDVAVKSGAPVLPIYIFDPLFWTAERASDRRRKFQLESLRDLAQALENLGSGLRIRSGNPAEILLHLAGEFGAQDVYATREHTTEEVQREAQVAEVLTLHLEEGMTLVHPEDLPFELQQLPDVFTRFRNKVEKDWVVCDSLLAPQSIFSPKGWCSDEIEFLAVADDSRGVLPFEGGAKAAHDRLTHYFWTKKRLAVYKKTRNGLLGADYSSKFSPWLANGCISPREVYDEIQRFEEEVERNESTYWLVFELLWRDYFRFVAMRHGPRLFWKSGIKPVENRKGDVGPGASDNRAMRAFESWKTGHTQDAFVNANMRELQATGFMSNRGRQNVASYLVHDLGVDWRWGAAYFEQQLIDYDPASNWGNWAYIAGVGNDPRPNRKFNTRSQAERYDPDGKYIAHWSQPTLLNPVG